MQSLYGEAYKSLTQIIMNKDNDIEEQCIKIHFATLLNDFDDIAYEPIKIEDNIDEEDMFGYNT